MEISSRNAIIIILVIVVTFSLALLLVGLKYIDSFGGFASGRERSTPQCVYRDEGADAAAPSVIVMPALPPGGS